MKSIVNKQYAVKLIIFSVILTIIHSCINSEYDFSKVNTDLQIGQKIEIPLGEVKPMKMSELMPEIEELGIDENGYFYFSYRGNYKPDMSKFFSLAIPNYSYISSPMMFDRSGIPDNTPSSSKLTFVKNLDINLNLPSEIDRLDSASLDNNIFDITFLLENIKLPSNDTTKLYITFPSNIDIEIDATFSPYVTKISANKYSIKHPQTNNNQYLFNIIGSVKKLRKSIFSIPLQITFPQGTLFINNSSPSLKSTVSSKNMEIKEFWGRCRIPTLGDFFDFDLKPLFEAFSQNDVISLKEPQMRLTAITSFGIPIKIPFTIKTIGQNPGAGDKSGTINILSGDLFPSQYFSISKNSTTGPQIDMNEILQRKPSLIQCSFSPVIDYASNVQHHFSRQSNIDVNYELYSLLEAESGLIISFKDTLRDVFKGIDTVSLAKGSLEMTGDIHTTIPLSCSIKVSFCNDSDILHESTLEVPASSSDMLGATGKMSILVPDLSKLKGAKHIIFEFTLSYGGSTGSSPLKASQQIWIDNMKAYKSDGITIRDKKK